MQLLDSTAKFFLFAPPAQLEPFAQSREDFVLVGVGVLVGIPAFITSQSNSNNCNPARSFSSPDIARARSTFSRYNSSDIGSIGGL
jgi:hypothetical protein